MPYTGIGPNAGKKIADENALSYAAFRCGITFVGGPSEEETEKFAEAFVGWYFSEYWRHEDES